MKSNISTRLSVVFILFAVLLFTGCNTRARVGPSQTESRSVELGDASSVRVQINMGAGNLEVTGGADKLLEAGFTYNVARLKPEVEYTDGTLVVRQPEAEGLPVLQDISDFRIDWDLRLHDQVPMELSVEMGAGNSDLQLANLSLTGLDITLGAGASKVDLRGDWQRDLDVTVDTGAANVTLLLPNEVGVRVEVDRGPTVIDAPGFVQVGNVYKNAAYGASAVTLHVNIQAGIGLINLEVEG